MTRQFTITHNGTDYGAEIATINSTFLGIEDHGILTFFLHCKWSDAGIGVGGYALDERSEEDRRRVGTAAGLDLIQRILATLGLDSWEQLTGETVVILFDGSQPTRLGSTAAGIAHPTDDKVLIFKDHFKEWEQRQS